jgi:hypothetical protein
MSLLLADQRMAFRGPVTRHAGHSARDTESYRLSSLYRPLANGRKETKTPSLDDPECRDPHPINSET